MWLCISHVGRRRLIEQGSTIKCISRASVEGMIFMMNHIFSHIACSIALLPLIEELWKMDHGPARKYLQTKG